jgi:plastocyanin
VANHDELGMRALLEVRRDAPLVRSTTTPNNLVKIEGFAFSPKTTTVDKGTDVTWVNQDPTEHTVRAKVNSFGSDPLLSGSRFVIHFDRVGDFAYFCAIHPTMKARVRVVG